jgi:hypothetical protein
MTHATYETFTVRFNNSDLVVENYQNNFFLVRDVLNKQEADFYSKAMYKESVYSPDYPNMKFYGIKKNLTGLFGKNIDSESVVIPTDPHKDKTRLFEIIKQCSIFIKKNFELENILDFKRSFIHIMEPGSVIGAHNDGNDAFKGDGDQKHYSAVLIFNEDYEGGNFYFSNLGVSIKPKAGSLLIFAGDEKRTHGVEPVTKGYRVSMPIFFRTLSLFEK